MRILFVSPQHNESAWLSKAFRESAHSLRRSNDLRDGILAAPKESFDAIVMMILDRASYPALTTALAQFKNAAPAAVIVVVLGPATSGDRIAMLRAGADACFTHPYSYIEMQERMQVLHRTATVRPQHAQLPPPFQLDPLKRELVNGSQRLPLTKREYLLLECLMRQFDVPVPHDELLRYAWPEKEDIDLSTASPLVWRLRRKLKQHVPDVNIATVNCFGYQLTRAPNCVRASA
ncbi:response regulator transcription factor [Paraburkholderia phenazinium]|jgi:two-component system OmpR family response regulator|uniref:DNA-binding response regulator, OmpR family, contains REC and winged-helix (WHTH) domain n=1 Tax=Paraburkholderia phenazinium TaxID=60549 RepID=A0A1N6IEC5_9BURK|nr:winged helix-turn-helix domain-containing protein [Paraburkholderia phenazinium]SIO30380.1 DNA-binding response regulator, OmpR family, contains REC and winged-helix (wHTH) domain [Paraburkholderia phenazinium]